MTDSVAGRLRIAFVDDNAGLLDGVRRALRHKRALWEMEFSANSNDFIGRLAQERFDAVVSDMRMPGAGGVRVLRRVLECHPAAARIILTGQAHARRWLELLGPAQRLLAKPCPTEQLEQAISEAQQLAHQRPSDALQLPDALRELPAAWTALLGGLELEVPLEELEALAFAPSRALAALSEALGAARAPGERPLAVALGDADRALLLGAFAFEHLLGPTVALADCAPFTRGIRVAGHAHAFALTDHASPALLHLTVLAGMLHAVGELLAPQVNPRAPEPAQRLAAARSGAHLLRGWGLSDAVCEAVAHQLVPAASTHGVPSPLPYLHAARALEGPGEAGTIAPVLDVAYLEREGCAARLPQWRSCGPSWQLRRGAGASCG